MDRIQETIYEMLTENTGKHFLDSGGNSDRHWQRNQNKTLQDFINEDEQTFEVDFDIENKPQYVYRTLSVFHFLAGNGSNLELDHICDKFNQLNKIDIELADCELYQVNVLAWNHLIDYELEIVRHFNTYNSDSDLSQVLQGVHVKLWNEGQMEEYILIQIHGGCDVRGGYTNPRLFKCSEGMINEYLFEYMDSDEILDNELEYISELKHSWKDISFTDEKLEELKVQLWNT